MSDARLLNEQEQQEAIGLLEALTGGAYEWNADGSALEYQPWHRWGTREGGVTMAQNGSQAYNVIGREQLTDAWLGELRQEYQRVQTTQEKLEQLTGKIHFTHRLSRDGTVFLFVAEEKNGFLDKVRGLGISSRDLHKTHSALGELNIKADLVKGSDGQSLLLVNRKAFDASLAAERYEPKEKQIIHHALYGRDFISGRDVMLLSKEKAKKLVWLMGCAARDLFNLDKNYNIDPGLDVPGIRERFDGFVAEFIQYVAANRKTVFRELSKEYLPHFHSAEDAADQVSMQLKRSRGGLDCAHDILSDVVSCLGPDRSARSGIEKLAEQFQMKPLEPREALEKAYASTVGASLRRLNEERRENGAGPLR